MLSVRSNSEHSKEFLLAILINKFAYNRVFIPDVLHFISTLTELEQGELVRSLVPDFIQLLEVDLNKIALILSGISHSQAIAMHLPLVKQISRDLYCLFYNRFMSIADSCSQISLLACYNNQYYQIDERQMPLNNSLYHNIFNVADDRQTVIRAIVGSDLPVQIAEVLVDLSPYQDEYYMPQCIHKDKFAKTMIKINGLSIADQASLLKVLINDVLTSGENGLFELVLANLIAPDAIILALMCEENINEYLLSALMNRLARLTGVALKEQYEDIFENRIMVGITKAHMVAVINRLNELIYTDEASVKNHSLSLKLIVGILDSMILSPNEYLGDYNIFISNDALTKHRADVANLPLVDQKRLLELILKINDVNLLRLIVNSFKFEVLDEVIALVVHEMNSKTKIIERTLNGKIINPLLCDVLYEAHHLMTEKYREYFAKFDLGKQFDCICRGISNNQKPIVKLLIGELKLTSASIYPLLDTLDHADFGDDIKYEFYKTCFKFINKKIMNITKISDIDELSMLLWRLLTCRLPDNLFNTYTRAQSKLSIFSSNLKQAIDYEHSNSHHGKYKAPKA
jgi:hypothetical protein